MKAIKTSFLFMAVIVIASVSCKTGSKAPGSTKNTGPVSQPKNTFTINVGDVQLLTFKTNASTGYSWKCLNEKNDYVELIKKEAVQTSTLIGAPANETWSFKGIKIGSITLNFVYKRPWEAAIADSIKYTINVK